MRHAIENFTCPKGSLDLDRNTVNESTEDTVSTVNKNSGSYIPEGMIRICDNNKNYGIMILKHNKNGYEKSERKPKKER